MILYTDTFETFVEKEYIPFFLSKHCRDEKRELNKINLIKKSSLGLKMLVNITTNDIDIFLNSLLNDREITKATINRYRARVNAIFNYALIEGLISYNPVKKSKKYREIARSRCLNNNEVSRLLSSCQNSRNEYLYSIVLIALNTGMRYSEIISIKKEHIDINNKTIILHHSNTKSGQSRIIPLNQSIIPIFKSYYDKSNTDKVFNIKSLRTAFAYAMDRAGLTNFRFHDLRRTFATYLKDQNVSIYVISKLLGHSDIKTTERYLAENREEMFEAVGKLDF